MQGYKFTSLQVYLQFPHNFIGWIRHDLMDRLDEAIQSDGVWLYSSHSEVSIWELTNITE